MAKHKKPYPTFPLSPHKRGWCKKIRGKVKVICGHLPPDEALKIYHQKAAQLHGDQPSTPAAPVAVPEPVRAPAPASAHALMPPPATKPQILVPTLKDRFLAQKLEEVQIGGLTGHTYADYVSYCTHFSDAHKQLAITGLTPTHFAEYRLKLSAKYGAATLLRRITMIRTMLKWAYDNELIDRPVRYAKSFEKPSIAVRRRDRKERDAKHGKRLFTPAEILALIEKADAPLKAMILLGINAGFGNKDCASLPRAALDLNSGVVEFDRPKTGVERKAVLWPETVKALRAALKVRPKAKSPDDRSLVFLTETGLPLVREHTTTIDGKEKYVLTDAISMRFGRLLTKAAIRSDDKRRNGLAFYSLRRTFRTWADDCNDQHAIHRVMGHSVPGMSGIYIQEISEERLKVVADHVHRKLYAAQQKGMGAVISMEEALKGLGK